MIEIQIRFNILLHPHHDCSRLIHVRPDIVVVHGRATVHPPHLSNLNWMPSRSRLSSARFEQPLFQTCLKVNDLSCLIKSVKLRIVVRINHLKQDVEREDGHVHAEVDVVR